MNVQARRVRHLYAIVDTVEQIRGIGIPKPISRQCPSVDGTVIGVPALILRVAVERIVGHQPFAEFHRGCFDNSFRDGDR